MGIGKIFNKITGDNAEEMACKFLKSQGYRIIKRNYRNNIGEIDIICKHKGVIVFVEVKYKENDYFGLPREMVDNKKQHKIRNVAIIYLQKHKLLDKKCRFDVIEILGDNISHIQNCF